MHNPKSMNKYIVVTIKPWNLEIYDKRIKNFEGEWHLISEPDELNIEYLDRINPRYIFFPHWSKKVNEEIVKKYECVCFHETDLPYGAGGSPIQNLISRGHTDTMLTALKMNESLDSGPLYCKTKLSLEGTAQDIFIRASEIIADIIEFIVADEPEPVAQKGERVFFKRRKPEQSEITSALKTIEDLYNHIRMLDAETYPKAFIEIGQYKYEITKPRLSSSKIIANLSISKIDKK